MPPIYPYGHITYGSTIKSRIEYTEENTEQVQMKHSPERQLIQRSDRLLLWIPSIHTPEPPTDWKDNTQVECKGNNGLLFRSLPKSLELRLLDTKH